MSFDWRSGSESNRRPKDEIVTDFLTFNDLKLLGQKAYEYAAQFFPPRMRFIGSGGFDVTSMIKLNFTQNFYTITH